MGSRTLAGLPAHAPGSTETSTASTTIGSDVKITGQIYSKEDLYVDGVLEGTIEVGRRLTIGPRSTVNAAIKAREVVLLGHVQGNIEAAEKIEIRKDGILIGDIRTARILIEDGAYFKGSIDILRPAKPRLALLGSAEADTADAEAEREIREHDYTTLDDPKSLHRVLSKGPHPHPATAMEGRESPEPERTSGAWERR